MLYFPSTFQKVSFDALVFSQNGLEFTVECLFYYKLPKENLGEIYNRFSLAWHDVVISKAITTGVSFLAVSYTF